jgi:ankyrin repeat protein
MCQKINIENVIQFGEIADFARQSRENLTQVRNTYNFGAFEKQFWAQESTTSPGKTFFHYAAEYNCPEIIKQTLNPLSKDRLVEGYNQNLDPNALYNTLYNGDPAAKPNIETPMTIAIKSGNYEVIEALLKNEHIAFPWGSRERNALYDLVDQTETTQETINNVINALMNKRNASGTSLFSPKIAWHFLLHIIGDTYLATVNRQSNTNVTIEASATALKNDLFQCRLRLLRAYLPYVKDNELREIIKMEQSLERKYAQFTPTSDDKNQTIRDIHETLSQHPNYNTIVAQLINPNT